MPCDVTSAIRFVGRGDLGFGGAGGRVGMKEGRKCRGGGRGGKALAGRDGEPALAACPCSARALARPTAACGAGAAAGAGGPPRRPRPWQGGGEPRAGGNWIPEDGVGDLQLGGTGN